MPDVYLKKTVDREGFVQEVLQIMDIEKRLRGVGTVLIKPNIVSFEPYPTTTHPQVLRSCLEFFSRQGKEIIVADGPSIDVGDTKKVIQNHALNAVCTECGIPLIDLTCEEMVMVETGGGFELELSAIALNHNFIVSLPVLKRHFVCGLTGALKNQFGFLSHPERLKLHTHKDINRAIAELNTIVKPAFYILDAIQTLIGAQEVRHGGRIREVGYILAGEDPVSLDVVGLELLKKVEPRLEGKQPEDIPYIKHAIDLRVGEPKHFRICEL